MPSVLAPEHGSPLAARAAFARARSPVGGGSFLHASTASAAATEATRATRRDCMLSDSTAAAMIYGAFAMASPADPPSETKLELLIAERRGKAAALREAGHHPFRNDIGP